MELRPEQLFIEELSLPKRMPVVLYVVYQQSGSGKFVESFDISANWSVH